MDGLLHVVAPERTAFPTLDFKFQNTGSATAVLWKFAVIIEKVAVDPTPDFSAYVSVLEDLTSSGIAMLGRGTGRYLRLTITNNGWGPTLDGRFLVTGDRLDRLLSGQERTVCSELAAGATLDLIVDSNSINKARLVELRHLLAQEAERQLEVDLPTRFREWRDRERWDRQREARQEHTLTQFERFKQKFGRPPMPADFSSGLWKALPDRDIDTSALDSTTAFREFSDAERKRLLAEWSPSSPVPLGGIAVDYEARDTWRRSHRGSISPDMGGNIGGSLAVGPNGFVHETHFAAFCALSPGITYCCILDPDRGAHLREYSISRKVPAGDVENFQIVVGATKSAYFSLRLRFNVDKAGVVESPPFDIELWNPRNKRFHDRFVDGDVFAPPGRAP